MIKQVIVLVCLVCLLVPSLLARKGWYRYKTPRYGFQMMVPFETKLVNRTWPGGWTGVIGTYGDVKVYAMSKRGQIVSRKGLESLGLSITKSVEDKWEVIREGAGNGWKWYCTVKASSEESVSFGSYGTDEHSSYLFIMTTSLNDFDSHREAYDYWYENVKLLNDAAAKTQHREYPVLRKKAKKIVKAPGSKSKASKKGPGKQRKWRLYEASEYGFSMLLPPGAKVVEGDLPNGWEGFVATRGKVKFYGLTRRARTEKSQIAELVGEWTGIKSKQWELLDEGSGEGWNWYRTVEAQGGNKVIFGGYGQSSKASFLFVVMTMKFDYRYFKNDYHKWYESVKLDH